MTGTRALAALISLFSFAAVGAISHANEHGAVTYEFEHRRAAPDSIQVGDVLKFKVKGEFSGREIVFQPELDSEKLRQGGWAFYSEGFPEFTLIPLKGGELQSPRILLIENGTTLGVLENRSFSVQSFIKPGEESLDPLKTARPPEKLPFPWWVAALLGVLAISLVAALTFLLFRYSKRVKPQHSPLPARPPEPPHILALSELKQLEARRFLEESRFKDHYFGMSEIVKRYFERRYGFEAAESTTEEMLHGLRPFVSDSMWGKVQQLFLLLDRVKFTDFTPDLREGKDLIQECRGIIEESRNRHAS